MTSRPDGAARGRTFLDTHALVFLWEGRVALFGRLARRRLERDGLAASPFALLELEWLREVGRVTVGSEVLRADLVRDVGLVIAVDCADSVAAAARTLAWTRDPFDRLITAHAALHDAVLITRDAGIRAHYGRAVWE